MSFIPAKLSLSLSLSVVCLVCTLHTAYCIHWTYNIQCKNCVALIFIHLPSTIKIRNRKQEKQFENGWKMKCILCFRLQGEFSYRHLPSMHVYTMCLVDIMCIYSLYYTFYRTCRQKKKKAIPLPKIFTAVWMNVLDKLRIYGLKVLIVGKILELGSNWFLTLCPKRVETNVLVYF